MPVMVETVDCHHHRWHKLYIHMTALTELALTTSTNIQFNMWQHCPMMTFTAIAHIHSIKMWQHLPMLILISSPSLFKFQSHLSFKTSKKRAEEGYCTVDSVHPPRNSIVRDYTHQRCIDDIFQLYFSKCNLHTKTSM